MYIGSTSENGLHHLVYEVVDNSIDEALAGYCDTIDVTIHADNSITVQDNGRGIPVDMHPTEKIPAVELALTVLHAGGKFDKNTYKVSGGLHGVGVSVVNALSERLEVVVDRDGNRYRMAFVRGKTVQEARDAGQGAGHRAPRSGSSPTPRSSPSSSSTTPRWPTGCASSRSSTRASPSRSRTSASDQPKSETFFAKGGLVEFVQWLNRNKKPLHPKPIAFSATKDDVEVDLALQYDDGYNENTFTFVNNINTHEGGTHLTGFKAALTRTINDVAKRRDFLKKEGFTLSGEDIREGLTCVLHVKVQGAAVRGADQDQARQLRGRGHRQDGRQRAARQLPRGAPAGRAEHHREGGERGPGPRGGAQGARPDPEEVRPRERGAARQARRLLASTIPPTASSTSSRATRPAAAAKQGRDRAVPGDPAAARQDPERREGPDRQDPQQRGDPHHDHRDRHRRAATTSSSTTPATTRSS